MMFQRIIVPLVGFLVFHQVVAGHFHINVESDDLNAALSRGRSELNQGQIELLEEVLAADDAIIERQRRGIVDQILASIAGVGQGIGFQVLGNGFNQPLVSGANNATVNPAAPKSDVNASSVAGSANANATQQQTTTQAQQQQPTDNNDNHLFQQISKVIISSGTRNVTGIVDNALKIATPGPVRDLVNGILGVAYCNSIRRLLGRC